MLVIIYRLNQSKGAKDLHAGGTINSNNLSIDPFTISRSEESNNASNIKWLANTVVWGPGSSVLIDLVVVEFLAIWNVLFADSVIHISLDTTWCNTVDSDLLVTTVDGHASSKGLNGTLGSRVYSVLWNTLGLSGDGSHKDDSSTNFKVLVSLPSYEELSSSVDVEHTVELFLGNIFEVTERDDTRVAADDVQLSEVSLGLFEKTDSLRNNSNIGLDGNSLTTKGANLVANLFGSGRGVGIVDDDVGTTTGQFHGHFSTNATA